MIKDTKHDAFTPARKSATPITLATKGQYSSQASLYFDTHKRGQTNGVHATQIPVQKRLESRRQERAGSNHLRTRAVSRHTKRHRLHRGTELRTTPMVCRSDRKRWSHNIGIGLIAAGGRIATGPILFRRGHVDESHASLQTTERPPASRTNRPRANLTGSWLLVRWCQVLPPHTARHRLRNIKSSLPTRAIQARPQTHSPSLLPSNTEVRPNEPAQHRRIPLTESRSPHEQKTGAGEKNPSSLQGMRLPHTWTPPRTRFPPQIQS